MDDITFEIKCRQYLIKRLGVLERDMNKIVDKEKEKRKTQIHKLCKYKDLDEAAEAYGYDDITDVEYQEICDTIENESDFVEHTKTPKAAAVEILHDFMEKQNREINDLEWSTKSYEEQERIKKSNAMLRETHRVKQK